MALNQLKAGVVLSYVTIGLHNIIGLIYTPFMLRMMGQSEYGLYSLAASVVAYLTVLDLGFANAIVRYTAKFRAENKTKEQYGMFGMFFLLYIGISLLVLAIGFVLYMNVDSLFGATMTDTELYKIRVMMLLMIFNLAFTFPMSIWGAIITAYENFVFQKLVNIARIILNPAVMVVMLIMGYGAIGMVVVTTIFNVLTLLINWWYCRNKLRIRILFGHFRWGFLKEVSIYSFWIFLNVIMDRIYWSTGQFVLGMFKGAATVAVYAVAIQLQGIYMGFSTAVSGVFLPKVTALVTHSDNEKTISDLFVRTGRIQYIVMAFVLSGFILFGRCFIRLWAGEEYDDAYWIALCFFIPLTVPLVQNLGITILQARNQMKFRSIMYLIIAVLSLTISIPLAKLYGGVGCAVGTSLALIVGQVIAMNIYYYKMIHIDIPRFWKEICKMTVIPVLLGTMSFFLLQLFELDSVLELTLAIVAYSLVYISLFLWKGVNSGERQLIVIPLKRIVRRFI